MAAKKWEGPPCLAFRVPNTDVEIITFAAGTTLRGMVCNPKRLLPPTPWSGACPHCRQGRAEHGQGGWGWQARSPRRGQGGSDRKWGKAAMEAVRIMCSARLIPPDVYEWNLSPRHKARGKFHSTGWIITVERPEKSLILHVIHYNNQRPILVGLAREFRSEHVRRGLGLILSGHVPTDNEVEACMRGLREAEPPKRDEGCNCWELAAP